MPLPKEDRYTLADALTWDEHDHIELVEGMPVSMAPPSRVHQEICGEVHRQIANYLKGKPCKVYPAPFAVRLFEQEGDHPGDVDTLVEPDISIICAPDKLDDIGCKGAPDMVVEVLSPSTQRHDRVTKFNLYQRAGVREYWIVDPSSKSVHVFLLSGGMYQAVDLYTAQGVAKVNVLENCYIELADIFQT